MSCETETVPVIYYVEAEFDDQSGASRFGPISSRAKAEDLLLTLASRVDCKKATLVKEAQS
jgi:hypothetical protein